MTMTPHAKVRQMIREVADRHNVPAQILTKQCRRCRVVAARREVARLLSERGYSTVAIGRVLNKDHTTIVAYLGRAKKVVSLSYIHRWKKPYIAHLHCVGCLRCLTSPRALKVPKHSRAVVRSPGPEQRYLIPYAGADYAEYVWRERPPREDHWAQETRQADHAGQGR